MRDLFNKFEMNEKKEDDDVETVKAAKLEAEMAKATKWRIKRSFDEVKISGEDENNVTLLWNKKMGKWQAWLEIPRATVNDGNIGSIVKQLKDMGFK